MNNKEIRGRYAPSPTRPQHISGVRTALYNYLFAKKNGGTFILRIEDTDQTRFVEGAEQYLIDSLKWVGIEIDESPLIRGPFAPYRQSDRKNLGIYAPYAQQLLDSGHAYYAFDTPEELEEMRERMSKGGQKASKYDYITREYMKNSLTLPTDEVKERLNSGEPYVIRIKIPRNEEIRLHDIIRGWVTVKTSEMDDKVLLKSDGMPTYHLANVVDDYLMKISHVIRGEEWLPSAPLHVFLYECFGWKEEMPAFAHLPLILKPDGNGKLSKRDGDRLGFPVFSLDWIDPISGEKSSGFREAGYLPEAFINILAFLGWHPTDNKELFSLDELIENFSLERVSKSGAKFDPLKAKWFNQQYLRMYDDEKLADSLMLELAKESIVADREKLVNVCNLVKEKATFINELLDLSRYFFEKPKSFDLGVIQKKLNAESESILLGFASQLELVEYSNALEVKEIFEQYCQDQKQKAGTYMQLLRVVLTGVSAGPELWEIFVLLGKSEVIERLKAVENLKTS